MFLNAILDNNMHLFEFFDQQEIFMTSSGMEKS